MSANQVLDVFIEGKQINLVVPDLVPEVVDLWYRWFNSEDTTRFMQKHYYPNTQLDQENYFKSHIVGNPSRLQLGIWLKQSRRLIGMISLSNIDGRNQQAEIGGLIGDASARNMTHWLEANRLLLNHAENELNLTRIYGGSLSFEVALFYQRLLDFRHEGVLSKAVFKSGKFCDVYQFAKLVENKRS